MELPHYAHICHYPHGKPLPAGQVHSGQSFLLAKLCYPIAYFRHYLLQKRMIIQNMVKKYVKIGDSC
tara:strand:+ start:98 stop:298 length:201 start_codon:yes stop_codon:yes gene_type:complete